MSYMTISSQEKHNFSLCSCFHAHPTTLLLKILGGPMHGRSPTSNFGGTVPPVPPRSPPLLALHVRSNSCYPSRNAAQKIKGMESIEFGRKPSCVIAITTIVIVISKLLKRHSIAKRRATAYSRTLREIMYSITTATKSFRGNLNSDPL